MKFLSSLIALLLSANIAWAIPVHDNTASAGGDTVDQLSYDLSVSGACNNRLATVSFTIQTNAHFIDNITVGGLTASYVGTATNTDVSRYVDLWRRVGIGTGTVTTVITLTDFGTPLAATSSYCDVDQTTPMGTLATASNVNFQASVTVTSATGELVIDAVTSGSGSELTVGSGQTQRSNQTLASSYTLGTSNEPGAASVPMTWSLSGEDYWAALGVSLKPAPLAHHETRIMEVR